MKIPTKSRTTVTRGMRERMKRLGIRQGRPVDHKAIAGIERRLLAGKMGAGERAESARMLRNYYSASASTIESNIRDACTRLGVMRGRDIKEMIARIEALPPSRSKDKTISSMKVLYARKGAASKAMETLSRI